ncbi:unnamed protein product [Schistosoma margrebowiei]|uniref:Uncharacterized protein n=1 Tax=Schistosoma margrebowiei TaxID=48269 RepID=A0A3P8B7F8_9TREM|nr:unnamed protein product [Schistosoma margrebowiei]
MRAMTVRMCTECYVLIENCFEITGNSMYNGILLNVKATTHFTCIRLIRFTSLDRLVSLYICKDCKGATYDV